MGKQAYLVSRQPHPDPAAVRRPLTGIELPDQPPPIQYCRCLKPLSDEDLRQGHAMCPRCRPPDIAAMERRIAALEAEVARLGRLLVERQEVS